MRTCHKDGSFEATGDIKEVENLAGRGVGCVRDTHSQAKRALIEAFSDGSRNPLLLLERSRLNCLISGKESAAIVHDRHSCGDVTGACAEVNEGVLLVREIPLADRIHTDLEFESRRDTVHCLVTVCLGRV